MLTQAETIGAETKGDILITRGRRDRITAGGAISFKEPIRDLIPGEGVRVILDLSQGRFGEPLGRGVIVAADRAGGSYSNCEKGPPSDPDGFGFRPSLRSGQGP